MRTSDEMMEQIMKKASEDDRIRAVTIDGSRANKNAVHDEYSDFDICYIVTDVRCFTKNKSWIDCFGEILIVQCPMDWYSHPYDYDSHGNFNYLIQFTDGNRIDLRLIDIQNISHEAENNEPRVVLLNKDNFNELTPIGSEEAFYIQKPSQTEYNNTCNEFRWLSVYISKGLCRHEFYYAKYSYEVLIMQMFIKMLNWKIGTDHDFKVTTGGHSKYLKRFLSEAEMKRFQGIFPNGEYNDIWNKLFLMYDYFTELAAYVGGCLGYKFNNMETENVRNFVISRKSKYTDTE